MGLSVGGFPILIEDVNPMLMWHLPPAAPTGQGGLSTPRWLLLRKVGPVLIDGVEQALHSVHVTTAASV
eukprot:4276641-Pyramimonas_sp.AAC.2